MKHNKIISFLLIGLSVCLLAGGALCLPRIERLRAEHKLEIINLFDQKETVAELRIPTPALFVFRSLAINYLWIRADNLKNEGQYFDALHLARAICSLQPHMAKVWDFQGWNMAYNISVEMPTAPERWEWIRAGFELLRDEGLKYNPYSLQIYWSIAWTFQHKMGGITDDFHRYYKLRLAWEMMPLLTPIHSKLLAKPTSADLQRLAQATETWETLIADPAVAAFIAQVRQAQPSFAGDKALREGLLDFRLRPLEYTQALFDLMQKLTGEEPGLLKLDAWLRATVLRNRWKMDPAVMLELNQKYGPVDYEDESIHYSLDWRTPYAHALYWAWQGIKKAQEKYPDQYSFERIRLHRVVYHSLQDMYNYGNLTLLVRQSPDTYTQRQEGQELLDSAIDQRLVLHNTQDLRMFWSAYTEMLQLTRDYEASGEREPGGVEDASAYLARAAMQNLYLAGHAKAAQRIYNHLRLRFPALEEYKVDMEAYIVKKINEEIKEISPKYASDYIISVLRACFAFYGQGDDEQAALRETFALRVYDKFKNEFWKNTEDDPTKRVEMSYDKLRWTALMDLLYDETVEDEVKSNLMGRIQAIDPALFDRVMQSLKEFQNERQENRLPQTQGPQNQGQENSNDAPNPSSPAQ